MTSIGRDRDSAKRSAWASASVFGTSSANTIVKRARMIVTTTSAIDVGTVAQRVDALGGARPGHRRG